MRIKKNIFDEKDPSKKCRNYPATSDSKYMREKIDKDFPGMDLMPPWLDEDLANVTSTPLQISGEESSLELSRVFYGIETSDCPLPCTTISTENKLANKMGLLMSSNSLWKSVGLLLL